jgi:hypothetical protein
MNHSNENLKSLNKLLQGKHMAIESFNVFMSRIKDDTTKHTFQQVQDGHRGNAKLLAEYIQNSNGMPKENIGVKGMFANLKVGAQLGSVPCEWEIIKEAIEGETQGINMAEKVLRGNLDDKSRQLAGEVLQKDRESIEILKKLM